MRFSQSDETLPNFMKRKHTRKGEKKKQRARTKVQANKQLKRDACHTKVREPLSIETSTTSCMKHINQRKGSKAQYLFSKGWSINKVCTFYETGFNFVQEVRIVIVADFWPPQQAK